MDRDSAMSVTGLWIFFRSPLYFTYTSVHQNQAVNKNFRRICGFYWKSMTLKVVFVQSNDVERCRDVEHLPH